MISITLALILFSTLAASDRWSDQGTCDSAKRIMVLVDFTVFFALVFVQLGYTHLDDPCASDLQCNLTCSSGSFGFFQLCSPWSIGTAGWLLITSAILGIVASIAAFFTTHSPVSSNRQQAQRRSKRRANEAQAPRTIEGTI